jgi:transposase
MDHAAIDLHKTQSQIRILMDTGAVEECRVPTAREALTKVFGGRPTLQVLIEASTESEWVAAHLETLGQVPIVADPNYAPMYGTRSRRLKTDRRDVAALTEACRQGTYRAVHRRSAEQRARQWTLTGRDQLVRTRTRAIAGLRAMTRSVGARVPRATSERFLARLEAQALPGQVRTAMQPLADLIAHTTTALAALDRELLPTARGDATCRRLMTAPGIGPVTAVAFVAALDDPRRFRHASQVPQYLGLVPREFSSGESQRRGHVLRSAPPRVQALLVQAGWRVLRSPHPEAQPLKAWGAALATRRGRRIAGVALARRRARMLWAMWRDEREFHAPTMVRTLEE